MKKKTASACETLACKNSASATAKIDDTSVRSGSKNTAFLDSGNSDETQPSEETLQLSLMYLMSKFALTQEKSYAEAVYQHLHMLAVRCDTDSKPRFLYRSLAMDWVQMCRGQVAVNDTSRTRAH
jgi:hypothetical protein|tara:strand:+ start:253 stop:627 length:375 start_codon:yes stop_codon:yes gene_type:complete